MEILFLHQAFPAQFGRLALELTRRFGWRCRFLIEHLSACPTPSQAMLDALEIVQIAPEPSGSKGGRPWPQVFGAWLEQSVRYRAAVEQWCERSRSPDLIVAHGGQGAPIPFLGEVTDAPIVNYCEYYFPNRFADLTYRVDLPPAEMAPFYPRCINAPTLLALQSCEAGYAPTHFQRDSFPARYHPKIEVCFDGIDTECYRPRTRADVTLPSGRRLSTDLKVVTYVARGLESMRGFDRFVSVAGRIARERSDVVFVVAGSETTYYGWDAHHVKDAPSFQAWAMERHGADPSRFEFVGHVEPEVLAVLLGRSDLHLYPSVPFVSSWSFFQALACGCVVIGSDIEPVREVIEPGRTGLVAPLFDTEGWAEQALAVLADSEEFRPIGQAASELIRERYSLDACVPVLRDLFERAASTRRA